MEHGARSRFKKNTNSYSEHGADIHSHKIPFFHGARSRFENTNSYAEHGADLKKNTNSYSEHGADIHSHEIPFFHGARSRFENTNSYAEHGEDLKKNTQRRLMQFERHKLLSTKCSSEDKNFDLQYVVRKTKTSIY